MMGIRGRKQRKEVAAAIDRGLQLLAERQRQDAYDFLREAVHKFPDEPEIRLHYASSLLAIRPEDAAAEAVKAIELDPNEPMRLTRAASFLFKLGEVQTARVYAARAKDLAPPDFLFMPYLINLDGHFADLDGNDRLAEECLRLAVEREPDGEVFAVDLASFLAERGGQAEALEIIDEAMPRTNRKEPLERLRGEIVDNTSY